MLDLEQQGCRPVLTPNSFLVGENDKNLLENTYTHTQIQ